MLSTSSIACLSTRLGDKRLFSNANALQIADVVRRVVFVSFELSVLAMFLANSSPHSSS